MTLHEIQDTLDLADNLSAGSVLRATLKEDAHWWLQRIMESGSKRRQDADRPRAKEDRAPASRRTLALRCFTDDQVQEDGR